MTNTSNTTKGSDQNKNTQTNNDSKDPSRVEAGKKSAETRGHDSLSEAGRRGGENSQGSSSQNSQSQSGTGSQKK